MITLAVLSLFSITTPLTSASHNPTPKQITTGGAVVGAAGLTASYVLHTMIAHRKALLEKAQEMGQTELVTKLSNRIAKLSSYYWISLGIALVGSGAAIAAYHLKTPTPPPAGDDSDTDTENISETEPLTAASGAGDRALASAPATTPTPTKTREFADPVVCRMLKLRKPTRASSVTDYRGLRQLVALCTQYTIGGKVNPEKWAEILGLDASAIVTTQPYAGEPGWRRFTFFEDVSPSDTSAPLTIRRAYDTLSDNKAPAVPNKTWAGEYVLPFLWLRYAHGITLEDLYLFIDSETRERERMFIRHVLEALTAIDAAPTPEEKHRRLHMHFPKLMALIESCKPLGEL